jgi:hypothetical protein
MGVNVEAWVQNTLDLESLRALRDVLNSACPGPEVWIWDADDERRTQMWAWDGLPSEESIAGRLCFLYGVGFSIHVHKEVIKVYSLARWGGFLHFTDLRNRLRAAIGRVVRALGATDVIWLPDSFDFDPELGIVTIDSVRHHLLAEWGTPQPSLDTIDVAVLHGADHSWPKVWFKETIV